MRQDNTQSAIITVITRAILKAAKPLVRDFGEVDKLQISKKGTANFVTSADLRTERMLVEDLSRDRRDFGFITEEGDAINPIADQRFVIDPIDGTTNFIHAIPYFCISVAVEKRLNDGTYEPTVAVIYDPIHDEMFTAERGKGILLNGWRVQVSRRTEETLISTTAPRTTREGYPQMRRMFDRVIESGATLRCSGSAALDLAYVAAGRLDATWYHHLQRWDMAAGALLVQEAGGFVTTLNGDRHHLDQPQVLASNGLIHNHLVELLAA